MSKPIVNLTRIAIIQEIEDILETYSVDRRQFFSPPDLHTTLITYVSKHFSNCCISTDECQCASKSSSFLDTIQQEKPQREAVIRQGIEELYRNNYQIDQHILDAVEPDSIVSEIFS